MSIKSLKKQLMAAIAMVMVAAIALGSSTFAWFAANTKVDATGLDVTAKSNSQYLLIGDDHDKAAATAKTDAAGNALTNTHAALYADQATNADKKVYPAYYSGTETTKLPGTADSGVTLENMTANTWYTANNKNADKASDAIKNVKTLTEGELAGYRLTYKVWLTLTNDSENYSGTILMTPTLGSGDASTSIAVKIGSKVYKLNNPGAEGAAVDGKIGDLISTGVTTTENIPITSTTAVPVEIYVFVNGSSTNVNSNYINGGHTVTGAASVSFELTNATV